MTEPAPNPTHTRLRQAAQTLGLALDDAAATQLLAYLAMLQRWNRVYNLTAVRDPQEMLTHHVLDCLAVLPPLRRHAAGRSLRVLDVGSGGGLPGVAIAIMQPEWPVCTIDAVAKKASFVRQVAAEVPVRNLRALHGRVEVLEPAPAEGGAGLRPDRVARVRFASGLRGPHAPPADAWRCVARHEGARAGR
jgi:16S rRNA (guanine527-N7)-methyltransferase